MPFVVAALILLGVVTALNLVLTMAIIRRLRAQESSDPTDSAGLMRQPTAGLPAGVPVPDFTATATDGTVVSRAEPDGRRTVFAFFSADCSGCWERLPEFIGHVRLHGYGSDQIVSTVVGEVRDAHVRERVGHLGELGRVVQEPPNGPLARAFGVVFFPSFVSVDGDGLVEAFAFGVHELPSPASA